jgi:ABC-type antimicrobial peptide transport system permease subunit
MTAVVAAAWRVVLRRAQANWPILGAAMLTILLATTLLSAGPIYAGAVTLSGLRRTLHDSPITKANVEVSIFSANGEYPSVDKIVSETAPSAFSTTGGTILRSGRSESFALPGQPADGVKNLTVFAFFQNIEQHATIVSGAWPTNTSNGPVDVAIPDTTAKMLNLSTGSTFSLVSRRIASYTVDVRVVGIYRVNDATDPYWWEDPLDTKGVQTGASFVTYGPLVTTSSNFFSHQGGLAAQVFWRIYPNFDNLTVSEVSRLIGGVETLQTRLNFRRQPNDQFQVDTSLNQILRTAQKSLLVTRSGVLIVTVQLAILAGYALLLTSNLLVDQRRVETSLLHSRGASTTQIVTMAVMEALILAVPAALAGPWLAALSLRIFNHIGPLATISLPVNPEVTRDAYALAFVSAFGCVLALALPMLQSARTFVQARASRGRQGSQGLAQRAGIDLLLLAVAVLAYWQLSRYRGPITETVQGRLGIDPFLVAAPAIGLVAGAIIALRIVPLLARVIDRAAAKQRGLVASLGAWQVSRRPLRYARSALLLMIAMAIGLFALSYGSTWELSQKDQANYQIGADVRLSPDIRIGTAIPQVDLAQAQGQVGGVDASMPTNSDTFEVSRSAGEGQILAVDAAQAPSVVMFRPDLSDQSFDRLMQGLSSKRPNIPTVDIPGTPQQLAFDVKVALDPLPSGTQTGQRSTDIFPTLDMVIQDARGMLYRVNVGRIDSNGQTQRLIAPLAFRMDNGKIALPSYPVKLVDLEFGVIPLRGTPRTGTFELQDVMAGDRLDDDMWTSIPIDWSTFNWSASEIGLALAPSIAPNGQHAPGGFIVNFNSGAARGNGLFPLTFSLRPKGDRPNPAMTAIVNNTFLKETESHVGDTVSLDIADQRRQVTITGAVDSFPTLDPSQPAVIVDFPTLLIQQYEFNGRILDPEEWWLATGSGQSNAVASTLQQPPYSSPKIATRSDRDLTLRTDPVALGIIGALSLGFVAAGLFAAIGFAVSSAVSARERLTEFALLRALGLSTRQLSSWLTLENGLLVFFSMASGTVLGLLLAFFILPLVSLTQAAVQTVPDIIVVIPWRSILILEATSLVALAAVVLILATMLRRIGLGSSLRLGEE